jgi:hypothetical protein
MSRGVGDKSWLEVDDEVLHAAFDREPFGFTHRLHELELFDLSRLKRVASLYTDVHGDHWYDYFVSAGAPDAQTVFYSVPFGQCKPAEALDYLAEGSWRILLKRPEKYDPDFRELLDRQFTDVATRLGGIEGRIVRLDSSILISSAATITPFHFDPEISFFYQIRGDKWYHIYSPSALMQSDLEPLYKRGVVDIGQVTFAGRDPALEHRFALRPGDGMHQPVSYAFSFETDRTRAFGRTCAFNHYLRALHVPVAPVGAQPALDSVKAEAMRFAIPARRNLAKLARRVLRR